MAAFALRAYQKISRQLKKLYLRSLKEGKKWEKNEKEIIISLLPAILKLFEKLFLKRGYIAEVVLHQRKNPVSNVSTLLNNKHITWSVINHASEVKEYCS